MATPTTTSPGNGSVVASLRSLMPDRALTLDEAKVVAERQANRLLATVSYDSPPFPSSVIEELPRLDVQTVPVLPRSGMSMWSRGMWRVRLNGAESPTRRRFTLAHELKHILDAPFEDVIYRDLRTTTDRDGTIEAICDHFAACLLMPKKWVKRLYGQGVQDTAELAWRFNVSPQAMAFRLTTLGLTPPAPRCTGVDLVRQNRRPRRTYFRSMSTSHLAGVLVAP